MDARQRAFDRFFAEWQTTTKHQLERVKLTHRQEVAAAAAWNAALDWAAKQIQGETQ